MLASYKLSEGGIIHLVNMISLITDQGESAVNVFTGSQGSWFPSLFLSYLHLWQSSTTCLYKRKEAEMLLSNECILIIKCGNNWISWSEHCPELKNNICELYLTHTQVVQHCYVYRRGMAGWTRLLKATVHVNLRLSVDCQA